jgi:hypothetical protein
MPIAELDEFLEVASAALPSITEIIVAFPAEHRAGALEVAERRYRHVVATEIVSGGVARRPPRRPNARNPLRYNQNPAPLATSGFGAE